MSLPERKQTVLKLLEQLQGVDALKELFWTELNYERENKPLSMRGWPDSARNALLDDPILFASGGEDHAFHVVYCRLASENLQRNLERPIVDQLIREHPYCLFVFSDTAQSAWHFLNIKYDEKAADPATDTSTLEQEIDRMVYELYGLTDDEIKIVEDSSELGGREGSE